MQTNNLPFSSHGEDEEALNVFEIADYATFESLFSQPRNSQSGDDGRVVTGTVLPHSNSRYLFVDIGRKVDALLPREEAGDLQPGDEAMFLSTGVEGNGNPFGDDDLHGLLLSRTGLARHLAGREAVAEAKSLLESGEVCDVTVLDMVYRKQDQKFIGLLVGFRDALTGFLPAKCLGERPKNLDVLQGATLSVVVTKVEETGRKLDIRFSRTAALSALAKASLTELTVGATVSGKVTRFLYPRSAEGSQRPFGVLVRLDSGIEGMIHKSDLSRDGHIQVEDVFTPGQVVQVKVSNVDMEKQQVALSFADRALLRQLAATHLSNKTEGLTVGDELIGEVKRFVYERKAQPGRDKRIIGAVVALPSGAEALLHRNDCFPGGQAPVTSLFQVCDQVRVLVKRVDAVQGRVEVSYKDLPENQAHLLEVQEAACEELQQSIGLAVGATYQGVVVKKLGYGAFVRIDGGVEALLHITDIEPEVGLQDAALKKLPQELSVTVSSVEVRNGQLRVAVVKA
ncbi:MAG: S1 RNA-binding domain-containing protein [Candidatus Obscuribacter sp.]|nr:S1 RNA-binding domain-containing protein [Candidatus Obscuribacter sp.]